MAKNNDYQADAIQVLLEEPRARKETPRHVYWLDQCQGLHHMAYEIITNPIDEAPWLDLE